MEIEELITLSTMSSIKVTSQPIKKYIPPSTVNLSSFHQFTKHVLPIPIQITMP